MGIKTWGISHFRFRDDTTALNVSGGWSAAEDARANSLVAGNTYRIRFSIADIADNTGNTKRYKLRWKEIGGSWNDLAATGLIKWALSGQYAMGDKCSVQLLSQDQEHEFVGEGEGIENAAISNEFYVGVGQLPEYEVEFAFKLDAAMPDGVVYVLHLWWEGAAGYWVSTPGLVATLTKAPAAQPPVANFTGSPLNGDAPLEVTFNDSSTNNPETWDWNFGDGSEHSTAKNPVHEFAAPGSYTIILTVTNAAGSDSETKTAYIVVTEPIITDPTDEPELPPELEPAQADEKSWKRAHVGIDTKTYVIEQNTYQKRLMPAFAQRFASGELTYGDLSYWQYLSQEDWRGGEGEEVFDISAGPHTGYLKACGIRTVEPEEEMRLTAKPTKRVALGDIAGDILISAWEGTAVLIHGKAGEATIRQWSEATGVWQTAKSFNNAPYNVSTHGYPTCAAYAPPWIVVGTSKGRLLHLGSDVFQTGVPRKLIGGLAGWETRPIQAVLPLSGMLYFAAYAGRADYPWTGIAAVRWPHDPDIGVEFAKVGLTKTADQGPKGSSGLPSGQDVQMIWHQGAIWVLVNTGAAHIPENALAILGWSNGSDLLGYRTFPGFVCKGMASLGGRLLLIGNYARQAVIMTSDGVVVRRKKIETTWDVYTSQFCSVFLHHDHLLIGGSGTVRLWESDGGFALSETVFLNMDTYDEEVRTEAVVLSKDRYHMKVRNHDNTAYMWDCKKEDQHNNKGKIYFSRIDAGMREVPKLFSAVIVRTKAALDSANIVEVRANELYLGMAKSGQENQFWIPPTFGIKPAVDLSLRLVSGETGDPPEVESVALRYVPLGPQKHVWSFAIKAENRLRMNDQEMEVRSGLEIVEDLWTLILAQKPVGFKDIDGSEYTVMITDAVAKAGLTDKPQPHGKGPEFSVAVEMVQY